MEPSRQTDQTTPATPSTEPPGLFRFEIATATWWWSHETYRIHGFEPGEVVPTTALVLAHKHPDDRDRFQAAFEGALLTGEPFTSVHRIMAATGVERLVAIVGYGRHDADGRLSGLQGVFLDLSPSVRRAASADVRASAVTRGVIEQAKGMLALILRIDPEDAFDTLRTVSMQLNVPVRDLARGIVERGADGRITGPRDLALFVEATATRR